MWLVEICPVTNGIATGCTVPSATPMHGKFMGKREAVAQQERVATILATRKCRCLDGGKAAFGSRDEKGARVKRSSGREEYKSVGELVNEV